MEDDDEIRSLTKDVLELSGKIECISEYSSAEAYISGSKNEEVDIVLMDIGLPRMSGTECVRYCLANGKKVNFVMYTTHFDAGEVFQSLKAGAKGYVLKGGMPDRLIQDIQDVIDGGSPMSHQISRMVIESFHTDLDSTSEISKLTKQEWEVLSGLEKGLTYKEIAALKFVSTHTVRAQIRSIYEKLQVHSKVEAIKLIR